MVGLPVILDILVLHLPVITDIAVEKIFIPIISFKGESFLA